MYCLSIYSDYSLYHTDIHELSNLDFDCLYAYLVDGGREIGGSYIRNYHLIPYCRRPDNDKELEQESHLNHENIAQRISFDELRKRNVTSEQLLAWLAPVGVAEKYEMNNDSSDIFYQCKSPWFGPMCQYKFGHSVAISFSDIVEATFNNYSEIIKNVTTDSCYRFLDNCNQELWPRCLDWRDHEYQCHYGGQCIPAEFAKDNRISIDCLDGSDEQEENFQFSWLINPQCTNIQTFQCQERTTRYPFSFSCGDGQPSPADIGPFESIIDHVWDEGCQPLSQHCMMEWIVIPENPTMFEFFQFVYLTNRSTSEFHTSPAPDFICFDAQRCPALLATITSINIVNSLTCCHISNLIEYVEYMDFYQLPSTFLNFGHGMADCLYYDDEYFNACHLNDSNRFICTSDPNKCILPVAIGNGENDCHLGEDELHTYTFDLVRLVPFAVLCNGVYNYKASSLNFPETDETNCELWPCNNPYTRCDEFWHCSNGIDELNCPNSLCSSNEYVCGDFSFEISYCLPRAHLFDKYLDDCSNPSTSRQVIFYNGTKDIKEICRSAINTSMLRAQSDLYVHECNQVGETLTTPVHFFEHIEPICYLDVKMGYKMVTGVFLTCARFGYFPLIMNNRSIPTIFKQNPKTEITPTINPTLVSYSHRGIVVLHGILRETSIPSEHIHTEIKSQQRCLPISTLLNNTIINSGYLNRTKYYPLLCRQNRTMMCFYDNDLICICDLERFSNCFSFNHTMNYDCQGHNYCENDGQCFQNNETCPTKSTCVCQDCYYGAKCQFSTKGFLFSLDPILGYHIKTNISINQNNVFIVTIITQIHDPIHRQLIDDIDEDERRIWCLTKYSYSSQIYNSFINLFHFLVPLSINLVTTLIMIKKIARRRLNIYPQQSYQDHFQRQIYRHQHLFKRCMKSAHEPWIFLIGYFVSFIPSMMTFVVFVLPSKNYKSELRSFYEQKFRRLRRNP
ncbi:unnamed protein product [Rotaria socialis]|uniref:EGF-like domain-containing protein n=1 Tax=Rotaria socialis TaxID=392032 RepID=A0A820WTT7_9BILA|nr:unnamed protein product [Rotaria socialis]